MRKALALLGAAALSCAARTVSACAACGCGDATLTSMGTEIPYEGRLRASLELRVREDAVGSPTEDRIELVEGRAEASLAWAPNQTFMALVTLPALYRHVTYVNLAERTTAGFGDAELRGKLAIWRDRPFGPRNLIGLALGLVLPTAPRVDDAEGAPLPVELQPGSGSFVPIIGLSYATFHGETSGYISASAYYPLSIREGTRPGSSLRISGSVQRQLLAWLAVRGGIDTRVDARATEDGRPEDDSGGFIGFLSPEVLLQPADDWLIVATVRIPTIDALAGDHDEGPVTSLGAAVDF